MTKIGMQRVAFAAAAFLTLTITALTITVAAQSRDIQIAEFPKDTSTNTRSNAPGSFK